MRRSVCCLVLLAFAPGDWFGSAARGAAGERPLEPLDLEAEWKVQFQVLCQDLAQREAFARLAPQTHRAESLIAKSDRDPADVVLRRTAALLADLKRTSAAAPSSQSDDQDEQP